MTLVLDLILVTADEKLLGLSVIRTLANRIVLLEAGRVFAHHVEGAFERDSCGTQHSLFKKAADECYSVWDPARRIESREGIFRIGRPIAAGLGAFDKTCAKSE